MHFKMLKFTSEMILHVSVSHYHHHKVLSQRKSNKIQQCIKILFHIYMKLNMLMIG